MYFFLGCHHKKVTACFFSFCSFFATSLMVCLACLLSVFLPFSSSSALENEKNSPFSVKGNIASELFDQNQASKGLEGKRALKSPASTPGTLDKNDVFLDSLIGDAMPSSQDVLVSAESAKNKNKKGPNNKNEKDKREELRAEGEESLPSLSLPRKEEWSGSIMLEPRNLTLIQRALTSFLEGTPISELIPGFSRDNIQEFFDDSLPEEEVEIFENKELEDQRFYYLNSIAFVGEKQWLIWLNGKKITSTERESYLRLINASEQQASFEIKPMPSRYLPSRWRLILSQKIDSSYHSQEGAVIYDPIEESLIFSLRPNQALLMDDLRIIEGNPSHLGGAQGEDSVNDPLPNIESSGDGLLRNVDEHGEGVAEGLNALTNQMEMLQEMRKEIGR